jgi:hypothetical protein
MAREVLCQVIEHEFVVREGRSIEILQGVQSGHELPLLVEEFKRHGPCPIVIQGLHELSVRFGLRLIDQAIGRRIEDPCAHEVTVEVFDDVESGEQTCSQ